MVDDFASYFITAGFAQVDDDFFVLTAVFYGVIDKVGDDLFDFGFVSVDHKRSCALECDFVSFLLAK